MPSIIQDNTGRYLYLRVGDGWVCLDSMSRPLGVGSLGTVYLGYFCTTREPVAVKVINQRYSCVPAVRQRAREEAAFTFLHPNIVRMLGICEYENGQGPVFILSSYVDGDTLDTYCGSLEEYGSKNRTRVILQIALAILNALDYIHGIGLVHRDVKPSNIMVSREGIPKLMDLGIAGFEINGAAREVGFVGTALYAAPELICDGMATPGSDIYAMGITIFEALLGYNPFYSVDMDDVLHMQLYNQLPVDKNIPKRLYRILQRATFKDPCDRYWSAGMMAEDINAFLNSYV